MPVPPANGFLAILAAHRANVLWKARSFELDGRDGRHQSRCLTRSVGARAIRARGALNLLDHPVRPSTATCWATSAPIDQSIRSSAVMAARRPARADHRPLSRACGDRCTTHWRIRAARRPPASSDEAAENDPARHDAAHSHPTVRKSLTRGWAARGRWNDDRRRDWQRSIKSRTQPDTAGPGDRGRATGGQPRLESVSPDTWTESGRHRSSAKSPSSRR